MVYFFGGGGGGGGGEAFGIGGFAGRGRLPLRISGFDILLLRNRVLIGCTPFVEFVVAELRFRSRNGLLDEAPSGFQFAKAVLGLLGPPAT